jgi:hypothetical protein
VVKEDVSGGCGGHGGGPTLPKRRKTASRPVYARVSRQEPEQEALSAAAAALFICLVFIFLILLAALAAAIIFGVLWALCRAT